MDPRVLIIRVEEDARVVAAAAIVLQENLASKKIHAILSLGNLLRNIFRHQKLVFSKFANYKENLDATYFSVCPKISFPR